MVRSKDETHPQRARMATLIGRACRGTDVHADAAVVQELASKDLNAMGDFLLFLHRTGTITRHSAGYELFRIWCIKNEAEWMDVWKEWSIADVER